MRLAFRQVLPVAIPVVLLNFFFLWDSQVLDYFTGDHVYAPHSCLYSICYHTDLAYILENGIYDIVSSIFINPLMGWGTATALLVGVDGVCLACVAILFVVFFRRHSGSGRAFAFIKAVQLVDLCVMPLGFEILLDYIMSRSTMNYTILNLHVINIQGYLGVLSNFTNLDLVYTTTIVLALTTLVLRMGWIRETGGTAKQAPIESASHKNRPD